MEEGLVLKSWFLEVLIYFSNTLRETQIRQKATRTA